MRPFARAACAAVFLGICLYGAGAVTSQGAPAFYPSNAAVVIASLAIAAFALGVACYALVGMHRQAAEFTRFSRSLDITLSRLAARSQTQTKAITAMEHWLPQGTEDVAEEGSDRMEKTGERPQNVIPHPSAGKARTPEAARSRKRGEAAELVLARAISEETVELSLQPIVSIAGNAAAGFETFAHLELEDGTGENVRRLSPGARAVDTASFERLLIVRATETARRRLGTRGGTMPLHCPVSEALLDDRDACAQVIELFSTYPALVKSVILSVPEALLCDQRPSRRQKLAELVGTGIAIAAEGWERPVADLRGLRDMGVVHLKLDADRLLDRDRSRRKKSSGFDVVTAAAEHGIQIIACGIENDEDAVNLLDLGVDLMIGNRFSEPKRLRSTENPPAGSPERSMVNAC